MRITSPIGPNLGCGWINFDFAGRSDVGGTDVDDDDDEEPSPPAGAGWS